MPNPLYPYDLLKSIVQLSNASLPIAVKLDQMLQSISEAFQPDRCLLLEPEKIIPNGFFYRLVLEKKPLWVEEGSSFRKENAFPEEQDLLLSSLRLHSLGRWDLLPGNSLSWVLKALQVFSSRDGCPSPGRGGDGKSDSKR